jgi:hypothetical protein
MLSINHTDKKGSGLVVLKIDICLVIDQQFYDFNFMEAYRYFKQGMSWIYAIDIITLVEKIDYAIRIVLFNIPDNVNALR